MTYARPTCQHKATIQLLNLLSHLVFVPPDVRIEVRKVGSVHRLYGILKFKGKVYFNTVFD